MTTIDDRQPAALDRRTLLKGGASLAAGLALGGPFQALAARAAGAEPGHKGQVHLFSPDYGPLATVRDQTTGLPADAGHRPRGITFAITGPWKQGAL